MTTFSFYRLDTGFFTGASFSGPPEFVAVNTPAECSALLGEFDHLSQRVDLASGAVIDWQPPAPPDTALETWAWDALTKRWRATPTLAARKVSKWEQIRVERDGREAAGFPYMGKIFDSDPLSVHRINTAVNAARSGVEAGATFSRNWKTQDNSSITLDAAAMIGAPVALAIFAGNLHDIADGLRQQIDAALTIEALELVTWPAL